MKSRFTYAWLNTFPQIEWSCEFWEILIVRSEVHPQKVELSIFVTESGIDIVFKDEELNESVSNKLIFESAANVIVFNFL